MRRLLVLCGIIAAGALFLGRVHAQKPAVDQWPNYQANSNFSPLTAGNRCRTTPLSHAALTGTGAACANKSAGADNDSAVAAVPRRKSRRLLTTPPLTGQCGRFADDRQK